MDGLLMTLAIFIALVVASGVRRWNTGHGPEQTTEPPGRQTAPTDWPRDGGDNPSAP